jgi:hypothetical protein
MRKAVALCLLAALFFSASLAVRFILPANLSSNDPAVRALEDKYRSLAGYTSAIGEMESKAARVQAALWSGQALESFVKELPKGWVARAINHESREGLTLHRYAFSKEATLRDYPEFQRVLKRLEARPSTRIDTITLTVNSDGKRFATALITATIPAPATPAAPNLSAQ